MRFTHPVNVWPLLLVPDLVHGVHEPRLPRGRRLFRRHAADALAVAVAVMVAVLVGRPVGVVVRRGGGHEGRRPQGQSLG